jgi:hypothetical protein
MDELPPHARRLLDVLRTLDDPEPARRARADAGLRKAFAAHGMGDLPALEPSAPATAPTALRLSLGVKLALGLGAVVVLGAGVWQLRAAQNGGAPSALPHSAASARVPELEPLAAPPVTEAPAAGAGAGHVAQPRAKPSNRQARATRPVAGDDSALRSELRLLAAVDGMLRNDRYRDALRTLTESEKRAGAVVLSEERRALRVLALCGLGGNAQALRERASFLQHAPRSVLAERVRTACPAASERLAP